MFIIRKIIKNLESRLSTLEAELENIKTALPQKDTTADKNEISYKEVLEQWLNGKE